MKSILLDNIKRKRAPFKGLLHFLMALCLIFPPLTLWSPVALAQSLSKGLILYQKGRIPQAEAALRSALPSANKTEAPEILKLLGITQHMQGNTAAAQTSFMQALKLNPTLAINTDEVLDETVIPFFNKVKSGATSSPAPAAAVASPAAPGPSVAKLGKKSKFTFLTVYANVKASVYVDGILAGNTGKKIEISPGKVEIMLLAKGYAPKKDLMNVKGNYENYLNVTLTPAKSTPATAPPATNDESKEPNVVAAEDGMFAEPVRRKPTSSKPSLMDEFNQDTKGKAPPPKPRDDARNYGLSSRSKSGSSSGKQSGNAFLAVLPFGFGQYQNGDPVFGAFFTVSELAALFVFAKSKQEVSSSYGIIAELEEDQIAKGSSPDPEIDSLIAEHESYVALQETQATISISLFAVLAISGAIEALINRPEAKPKPRIKPGSRRSGTRLSLLTSMDKIHGDPNDLSYGGADDIDIARPLDARFSPSNINLHPKTGELSWGLTLDF